MSELKPCPFCGNKNIDSFTYGESSVPFVPENVKELTWGCESEDCIFEPPLPVEVSVWNTRSDKETKREAITEMLALHDKDREKVSSQCNTLINISTVTRYLEGLE